MRKRLENIEKGFTQRSTLNDSPAQRYFTMKVKLEGLMIADGTMPEIDTKLNYNEHEKSWSNKIIEPLEIRWYDYHQSWLWQKDENDPYSLTYEIIYSPFYGRHAVDRIKVYPKGLAGGKGKTIWKKHWWIWLH